MAGRGPRTGVGRRVTAYCRGETAYGTGASPYGRGGPAQATTHGTGTHRRPDATGTRREDRAGTADAPPPDATARTDALVTAALVRIRDLAGRPRGVGFLADHEGTLLTSHESVDGLARLVLHAGDRTCVVDADAVTELPARDLALVRTEGLGTTPLPLTVRESVDAGTYVRIAAGGCREARLLAATEATYTATDRFHLVQDALDLAIGTAGRDALRLGGGAAGGPVLDARTGAVLGVLGTALRTAQRDAGFAVPLRPADGPLAELLARNAATVPAYGADLNLAAVLELTAASVGRDGPPGTPVEPAERTDVTQQLATFADGDRTVLGLVGPPGSGRTTELAALAARRRGGERTAPTLWLRGADLADADTSVADAARRALQRAARIVAAARAVRPADLGDLAPDRLACLAAEAGRPLLLLLDGPEEMPPALAHRLAEWTRGTTAWLRRTGTRLVVACREEYWERAALLHSQQAPPAPGDPVGASAGQQDPASAPPCVRLGDLDADAARRARARYRIPEGVLAERDERHPLTLRLLSEVLAAVPQARAAGPLDRHAVFAAYLDLMCLRIAARLAAGQRLRGTAVRRLAARVAGQVHEAARRSLGPGQGELDRESFEEVFPWGRAPARLGGGTGWACAVLTEGLLVPAGGGYRFAHEELADWIQGMHLDLDEALHALVHRARDAHEAPVPHHRVGPVVQALLLLARQRGARLLSFRLRDLVDALDLDTGSWWAARLLGRTLLQVPDAAPYTEVLRLLADRIVGWRREQRPVPAEFGPAFWTALPLSDAGRLDLLRRLVLADQAPPAPGERYLDAVARLLAAAPAVVVPHLTSWFDDERPLPATPYATVATAAQALLHTHRHVALDELTEALVAGAHRRADELLTVLAEEEPPAVCRAVDRWAHDERPERRAAAVTYGLRAAPHVRTAADRELLRYTALTLLARPADRALHGGALALLVRDPHTRDRHLAEALRHFSDGDPQFPPSALLPVLTTHPEPVLRAFRARLHGPHPEEAVSALADVGTAALARRAAPLLREAAGTRPETAREVAAGIDRRLGRGPTARPALLPLVTGLLDGAGAPLRAALAGVLAAPGTAACRPLRRELLEILLRRELDPTVLDAVLHAAATHPADRDDEARGLVHRTGLILVRTPEGATRFDRALLDLARQVPGFAARTARWLAGTPGDWAAVVGPSTRRMLENLAGVRVPA